MCCEIPEAQKAQTCKELPSNYLFCFKERASNPDYEGLLILTNGGRYFKSFENIFSKPKSADYAALFYSHVGLLAHTSGARSCKKANAPTNKQLTSQAPPRLSKASLPYTPHKLLRESCGNCANCLRPDCSSCVCCRGNKRSPSARNCCLQKVRVSPKV